MKALLIALGLLCAACAAAPLPELGPEPLICHGSAVGKVLACGPVALVRP